MAYKRNERDWTGQLISWLKAEIERHTTIFQDATNDTSINANGARTKFPDILLFIDKVSGVVFNGWELKFPDTAVDDAAMLGNALEKAKILESDSFVTWNGTEAVIWGIDTGSYSISTLRRLKTYPKIPTINTRDDLALPSKYSMHEATLRSRAIEILHDLDVLCREGHLKPAINITGNIIAAIHTASEIVIPQLQYAIEEEKGRNKQFREEFGRWRIYESSTLKILQSSSRRKESISPEQVLAKFTFYNYIGKTIFYLTLSENLSGELEPISTDEVFDMKLLLNRYFSQAAKIDYKAIFKPYFTDCIAFSPVTNATLSKLLHTLTQFDFKVLPTEVIGTILENLVPAEEKQKFGQYFTPPILADLVAFPAVGTNRDTVFDPTSGTDTFLDSFYNILKFYGSTDHTRLLGQIWGNDVSHFPAILSVINLYKHGLTETSNFPRVMREDFFNLEVGQAVTFPNPRDHAKIVNERLPLFDGIASNFPFIQQEDIPNSTLASFFKEKFATSQGAFLRNGKFCINERSDYFTYCTYNALRFLKPSGCLSAITSNAWLGKEYGLQFKKFLLDNFHIKYVVRSNAEHWFHNSQVATVYFFVEHENLDAPTLFVTINKKLDKLFSATDPQLRLRQIEEFYIEIENCDNANNKNWTKDQTFENLYTTRDGSINVCIVARTALERSIGSNNNWNEYFISSNLFGLFEPCLTQYFPRFINVFRGERTGWNDMFVIKRKDIENCGINEKYLMPYVKTTSELKSIEFDGNFNSMLFVCNEDIATIDPRTRQWIEKYQHTQNKNGSKTIQEACQGHRPYWYSLRPKQAQIITAVNPYDRFFFAYSAVPFAIDQRLIAITVNPRYNAEVIAALLNSAITFLVMEVQGISRNLGALDLNANFLKRLFTLNPELLTEQQAKEIIKAFQPLKKRKIGTIADEIKRPDRIAFDSKILECYGFNSSLLETVYNLLGTMVNNRVSMRDK